MVKGRLASKDPDARRPFHKAPMLYLGVFSSKSNEHKMTCGVHSRFISSAKSRSSQAHLNECSRIREGCPKGHRLIAKPNVSGVSITLSVIEADKQR
jgi:hypothetical protein